MRSFLLIGQSNMAGRAPIGSVPPIENPDCFMLRNGRFLGMHEPICNDRAAEGSVIGGIGPGASFADAVQKRFGGQVGLIPCADGGTKLAEWQPGEVLFEHMISEVRFAMRSSELAGILWHQGEGDCWDEARTAAYRDGFLTMWHGIRKELGIGDLPLMLGGLGDFLPLRHKANRIYSLALNDTLKALAAEIPNAAFISAEGLTDRGDCLHFDGASQREFGLRYFAGYCRILGENV